MALQLAKNLFSWATDPYTGLASTETEAQQQAGGSNPTVVQLEDKYIKSDSGTC